MAIDPSLPSPGLRGVPVAGVDGQITRDWQRWLGALSNSVNVLSAGGQVFVQPDTPTVPVGQSYWWVQTGLGASGDDFTVWFEDGLS